MEVDTATGSAHHGSKGLYREQNQVSEDEVNELLANKASAEVQASVRGGMANSKCVLWLVVASLTRCVHRTYIFVFDSSGEGRQAASNKLSDFLIAEAWDKRGIRSEQIISPEYMRVKVRVARTLFVGRLIHLRSRYSTTTTTAGFISCTLQKSS